MDQPAAGWFPDPSGQPGRPSSRPSMSSEPTEMAGVAEAETQAAYAWALDDGDDLPTQRLTPRASHRWRWRRA